MSSFDRRSLLISFAALAGCGFTPVYGPANDTGFLHGSVLLDDPTNLDRFEFVKYMERRLGAPQSPKYTLSYQLRFRGRLEGRATFVLRDINSGKRLTSGQVESFTNYEVGTIDTKATPPQTSATISNLAAKRDAKSRLIVILADQIVAQLLATAGDWAQ